MKKTYIVPSVEVMNITKQSLLANSPLKGVGGGDGYQDGSVMEGREDNYDDGASAPNLWDQGW